jgi:hypothetical protein
LNSFPAPSVICSCWIQQSCVLNLVN